MVQDAGLGESFHSTTNSAAPAHGRGACALRLLETCAKRSKKWLKRQRLVIPVLVFQVMPRAQESYGTEARQPVDKHQTPHKLQEGSTGRRPSARWALP